MNSYEDFLKELSHEFTVAALEENIGAPIGPLKRPFSDLSCAECAWFLPDAPEESRVQFLIPQILEFVRAVVLPNREFLVPPGHPPYPSMVVGASNWWARLTLGNNLWHAQKYLLVALTYADGSPSLEALPNE
jgi:hypothetical protein